MAQKKRKQFFAAVMLGLAVHMAGCGGEAGNDSSDKDVDKGGSGAADQGETGGIILAEGERLYAVDQKEYEIPAPDGYLSSKASADAWGEDFYILTEYAVEGESGGEERLFFLNIFDGQSREMTQNPFSLELPEGYSVSSMEAQGGQKLSFRLTSYDEEAGDILLETDLEGNVTLREDSFPDEEAYPWNPVNTVDLDLTVYDNTDGTVILSQWNMGELTTRLFWYDREDHSRRAICELTDHLDALYLDSSQVLYYISGGSIVRRGLADLREEQLFSMQELPDSNASYMALIPGAEGELLFCTCEATGGELQVFTLSNKERETVDEIRMAYLSEDIRGQATEIAAEYSLSHQDCPIRVETAAGDEEDFRNKILIELAAGKGPELIWVSMDDLEALAEKGVLMDMRELIPEELMEQIFHNVIQAGSVDGTMVALATQFTVSSLVTSNQVWEKDSWTLQEFMDVVESRDSWRYMVTYPIFGSPPLNCLRNMLPNLEDTPFLDMGQRKAHFDHEDFIRALELCKRFGAREDDAQLDYDECWRMLKDGECVVQCQNMYDGFPGFSKWMAQNGDSCHFVGAPGSGAGGWIEIHEGLLAVNAKAEHIEEIKEYIALLLDDENQLQMPACNVRMDVTRDCLEMVPTVPGIDETTGEEIQLYEPRMKIEEGKVLLIDLKPDKTSYLEEYMDFLENAAVKRGWPEQIDKILVEELAPYFNGDREAEDAVANIQNRVQLYLYEKE